MLGRKSLAFLLVFVAAACTTGQSELSAACLGTANSTPVSLEETIDEQGRNPTQSGVQVGNGPESEPRQVWSFEAFDKVQSLHATADGLVHVGEGTSVHLLDTETGEEVWELDPLLEYEMPETTTLRSGTVYDLSFVAIGSKTTQGQTEGAIVAYELSEWRQEWAYTTTLPMWNAPVVTEDMVYARSSGENVPPVLWAWNRLDGTSLWDFAVPREDANPLPELLLGTSYLAVGTSQVYFAVGTVGVYGVSRTTGEQCWKLQASDFIVARIAYSDNTVFMSQADKITALDATTGKTRWSSSGKGGRSSPAVADGVVYVGGEDGSLYALGARTGDGKWVFEAGDFSESSPVIAGDEVYAVSGDGSLYAISVATGTKLWSVRLPELPVFPLRPVVAGDKVFIATENGVIAFG